MKIVGVVREARLNGNTMTLLYKENAQRIDLDAIDKFCELFDSEVADLLGRAKD